MSKSEYENYIDKRHEELLQKECTLEKCIEVLKKNKKVFSSEYMEAQIELVVEMFNLLPSEIERVVYEGEYLCM